MIKVYIAGPYTGDQGANTRNAILAADDLFLFGMQFLPFIPHLCHLWHMISPHPYELWMYYSLQWLAECDCVLRLPGESPGADREVEKAREMGRPVFYEAGAMVAYYEEVEGG